MAELFLVTPRSTLEEDELSRATALDSASSFLVEAPAGSGKTGLLIQRFLKLLAAENVTEPEQIRAITFTRKATVEMRDRVLAQLQAAANASEPTNAFDRLTRPLALAALDRDRHLGWRLLDSPHRLKIGTIDSVCLEITRALPVLSGSAVGLKPTDDAATLYTEAARRTLMLLGGEDARLNDALEDLLLHRDANLLDCERLIASMLGWRDQWGELIPIANDQLDDVWLEVNLLPRLNNALRLAVCRGLTRISGALPAQVLTTLTTLAAEMGAAEGYNGGASPIAICAGKYGRPGEEAEHLAHWRALIHLLVTPSAKTFRKGLNVNYLGFMIRPEQKKQLTALIDQVRHDDELCATLCSIDSLPPDTFPPDQWAVSKSLFRVLSRALVELQFVFAEQAQCDFTEFALIARSALRQDDAMDDLRRAAGVNLQHLLVDEMQDTSTSQYELIELLTRRWDGHSQTVFLVGDPKQSIYLFRQARVERFVQTMQRERLGDLPLEALRLSLNFRSQAHLVDAFNEDFIGIFPAATRTAQPDEVSYSAVEPACLPGLFAARVWHGAILPYSAVRDEALAIARAQRLADAQQIRAQIRDWLSRPLPEGRTEPWKIAILVRSRSHLPEIIAALKQSPPIAYRAVDIEPLGERQEILDLLALTRALLHPADRTAWLGLLRSPWCGLTLSDLYQLAGQGEFSSTILELIEERGDLLSEDGIARLKPFYSILRAALSKREQDGTAAWVEQTWRMFHTEGFLDAEQLANVESYFDLLDAIEQSGGRISLATLSARLGKLYARAAVHPGAVDLMTIHGAKGLEWDVVFLPALERKEPSARARLLNWVEIEHAEAREQAVARGILAPIPGKGLASEQLNRWMRSVESAREAAERKRLFYVACTRARQELHLFASPTLNKSGDICRPSTSLLAAAWPAAEEHFRSVPAPILAMSNSAQPSVLATIAAGGARFVPRIERIPLSVFADSPRNDRSETTMLARFTRPEGSFASRAFGNTVHAMLEQAAQRLATGITPQALLTEVAGWHSRILHQFRANGLPPSTLERLTGRALLALRNILSDPTGCWLLAPHPGAASEQGIASPDQPNLRVDRIFYAGEKPLSIGETHLWIIDFKTAELGGRDLETFLQTEHGKYKEQMRAYATALSSQQRPVRVALYYPLLSQFICY